MAEVALMSPERLAALARSVTSAELWEQGRQSQCPVSASKHQLCLERKNPSPPSHCIVGAQEGLPAAHPLQEFAFL